MHITFNQALVFLVPVLPLALWIAWSDMKYMRITNKAVMVLAVAFLVTAPAVLPFDVFLWRLVQVAVILLVGFIANALGLIGGGDAKYAAVMAGFFDARDFRSILLLFVVMLVAALILHRSARRSDFMRSLTPDWKSWTAGQEFPMGLALSGTILVYLFAGLFAA